MKKLSDQIRSTSGFRIGISGTRINVRRSIFKEYADKVAQLEAENELWKQRVTFAEAKRIAEAQHDYNLAAYMLRDLPLTKSAELADLAHALHSETASKGDWVGLRDLWDKAFREALKAGGE